jgi:hypothetical protein
MITLRNDNTADCGADCDCAPVVPQGHPDLTIGEAARLTGIGAKTIRFYEDIGLLPPARRSANRYRRYGQADVNRLVLLRRHPAWPAGAGRRAPRRPQP